MNILVTGSSGTIGTRLCETLLEQGHSVVGIDWKPNKWQPAIQKITTIVDLRDAQEIQGARFPSTPLRTGKNQNPKFDAVVHLAANARVYDLVLEPELARDNMLTTFNVLEFARLSGIPRVIFASSRESYGNAGAETYTEDMVRIDQCESPYTASKLAGEALFQAYRRCYDMSSVIVRFSNVYGMYDDSNRVVPLFIRKTKKNEPISVFGKDKCLDFTYIDDAVAGILLILRQFDTVKNEVFNLAYGQGINILHVAETVKDLMKSSSKISLESSRTGEVTRYTADISKAKKMLGFAPKTDFEEGIRKSVAWYTQRDFDI